MYTLVTRAFCLLLVALTLGLAACDSLSVENQNAPDRQRALAEPDAIEALIFGTWRGVYWARTHTSTSTARVVPLLADEFSATYANNGALDLSSEPRTAYNNTTTSDVSGLARFQWEDWYEALSNANEALFAIEQNDIRLTTGEAGEDNTERGRAFARFFQGMALGYLGVLFDQASIADETTDLADLDALAYQPYDAVVDAAIEKLQQAITLAQANSFVLPASRIGFEISNERLARMAHSWAARFAIWRARTPEERAALDWQQILSWLDNGIQEDVVIPLDPDNYASQYLVRAQSSTSFSMRADAKLVGPADVSGAYQTWLNTPLEERQEFEIVTPDRRITGADGPQSNGLYFRYRPAAGVFRPDRGTYHFSSYQWYRYGGNWDQGTAIVMSVDEMNLYKAEAHLRLNQPEQAAALINRTRMANGALPAVTAAGVPQSADCVPRNADGTCGTLMGALHYERMIELAGMDALRAYLDRRGFGTLAEGTFLQLPVSARELETLGLPLYTFGGAGGQMSADADETPQ